MKEEHLADRADNLSNLIQADYSGLKSPKLNLLEFTGDDVDTWIAVIEQYFEAPHLPLDQRTSFAISYLKGSAAQWWRGTGYVALQLPWHRFYRYLGDRFAEASVCDNVRNFHSLTQEASLSAYIEKFEAAVTLMRRDNPALPNDYYVNSFISGLHPYIQHHLQCHKPQDMHEAMWVARRLEHSQVPVKPAPNSHPPARRQVTFEQKLQT